MKLITTATFLLLMLCEEIKANQYWKPNEEINNFDFERIEPKFTPTYATILQMGRRANPCVRDRSGRCRTLM